MKNFLDSIASYFISGFLMFYGFVIHNGSDIAIFLGVIIGIVRLTTDSIKLKRTIEKGDD